MTDLHSKIMRRAEFDDILATDHFHRMRFGCRARDSHPVNHDKRCAKWENVRLLPLIEALAKAARALERICEKGYPCQCCDLGYDKEYCTCFDEMDRADRSVQSGSEALSSLAGIVGDG